MATPLILLTVIISSTSIALYVLWKNWTKPQDHFPPGPPPRPLIGNLFDFPTANLAQTYIEWGVKYKSDILHASAFGSHIFVLNKLEDAVALLDERSQIYSDRLDLPVLKLMGWERNIALMPYGNTWRLHKKVAQQHFRQGAASEYNPVQLSKMKIFLRNLLESPDDFAGHNKLFSVSVPLATMYGYDVDSIHDPVIEAADQSALIGWSLCLPGGSMINVFPPLRHLPAWFPGFSSKQVAMRARELTEDTIRRPMERLHKQMAAGPVAPSLVSSFLERKIANLTTADEEEVVTNLAYTTYGAASDTTIAATNTFLHLIAAHPEVQRKAQAEIDSVVGVNQLPGFEDRASLPYVEAIYLEVLRWQPPLDICIPHISIRDDYYKGYFIPKGSAVIANLWAMAHDPSVYEDADRFMPERFIDSNGGLTDDHRVLAYGFGRRICAGKHVASSSMWLLIVSVLATFNIGKAKDENGNDIAINEEYEAYNGFMKHKTPFRCSIIPRSERAKELIME